MTTLTSRDWDDVTLDHVSPGPWMAHIRARRARRHKCTQPVPATKYETFKSLAKQWQRETWYKSSLPRRISHPAYLKIIGLGADAVPWILDELRDNPDYWFAALEAITREDPARH